MKKLPDSKYFQYFSHLYHKQSLIPFNEYIPIDNWDYPKEEKFRFEKLFLSDIGLKYIENSNILDLGCHCGYLSFISKHLGAKSVHGVNVREFSIEVANYVFDSLGIEKSQYQFDVGDIENPNLIEKSCQGKDTVILTDVIDHLKNPYGILENITKSKVKNIIFQCALSPDVGYPALQYYKQDPDSNFAGFGSVGAYPNTKWLDLIFYDLGWKIEEYTVVPSIFQKDWFAIPNLKKFTPALTDKAFILATKFNKLDYISKNNYENV
jgi:hypothetical protein